MDNKDFLGKKIKVWIDRPMGSGHPEYPQSIYPINYGYVPGTISGDGKELDCFVLGVFNPITEFEGVCIALIHRINDNEDKLVIAPEGKVYSDDAIEALVEFQERWFKHTLIRWIHNQNL